MEPVDPSPCTWECFDDKDVDERGRALYAAMSGLLDRAGVPPPLTIPGAQTYSVYRHLIMHHIVHAVLGWSPAWHIVERACSHATWLENAGFDISDDEVRAVFALIYNLGG